MRAGASSPKADGSFRTEGQKDHRVLRMRVGSDGRAPIWAEWPMILHRPIPANAVIKWAVVSLNLVGPRERWTVQLTVSLPDVEPMRQPGMVALNVGWRRVPGGLRVASWVDDAGHRGQLLLEDAVLGAIGKARELQGLRAQKFDAARLVLASRVAAMESPPEWLAAAHKTLAQWRSAGRLAALARSWRERRFMGDEEAYEGLEAWRYGDHHLWTWESSQRDKSLRRRREVYRVFASQLASRYGVVVLEKFDKAKLARRPSVEAKAGNETARSNRHLAAVSEFCGAVINAVKREGGRVMEQHAVDATHICHVCGVVGAFDAAAQLLHTCDSCGATWDQDENAAENLLGRAREHLRAEAEAEHPHVDGNEHDSQTVKESRWGRAKRMSAEKMTPGNGSRSDL